MQSKFEQRQQAKKHITEGFKKQSDARQGAEGKENIVASIDFNNHRETAPKEKDEQITELMNAVNVLSEKVQRLEGGGE